MLNRRPIPFPLCCVFLICSFIGAQENEETQKPIPPRYSISLQMGSTALLGAQIEGLLPAFDHRLAAYFQYGKAYFPLSTFGIALNALNLKINTLSISEIPVLDALVKLITNQLIQVEDPKIKIRSSAFGMRYYMTKNKGSGLYLEAQ